jgi:hypothetical protein
VEVRGVDGDSLARVAGRYTLLRLGCVLGGFVLAYAVLAVVDPRGDSRVFKAVLAGIVLSVPASYWWGRGLRARMTLAIDRQREVSRARVQDTAARVQAVTDREADPPATV